MPASAPAAGVVHRKLGNPPLGHLALDPRQRRPNQLAMHGTVCVRAVGRLCLGIRDRRNSLARSGFNVTRRVRQCRPGGRRLGSDHHASGGGPATGFFFRVGGTFASRYTCSESHAVQRTWRTSPSTIATIA
jgi:hypothetical protein